MTLTQPRHSRHAFLATLAALPAIVPTAARAATSAPIRLGLNPIESEMEPYYALDLGMFAKAGLDVEISSVNSGAAAIQGVVAGALDVGVTSVVQMATAALHGVPLKYIASGVMCDPAAPFGGLAVAANTPIQNAKDFEGKTMSVVALHDLTHLITMAYLIKGGADPTKVSFVEVPYQAVLPAVAAGRVAGGLVAYPFMPVQGDGTRILTFAYDAIAPRYMSLGYMATAGWIEANTAVAKRFATVIYQAARWANNKANNQQSAEIMEKYTKVPAATTVRGVRSIYGESLQPSMVDPVLDWEYRLKFMERRVTTQEVIAQL